MLELILYVALAGLALPFVVEIAARTPGTLTNLHRAMIRAEEERNK